MGPMPTTTSNASTVLTGRLTGRQKRKSKVKSQKCAPDASLPYSLPRPSDDWRSRRYSILRNAPVLAYEAKPKGADSLISPWRRPIDLPVITTSTIGLSSIHAVMRSPDTCRRSAYQRPFSKLKYALVSLSDASQPSRLDSPTMSPPQPPVTHVQNESPTGN